MSVNSREEFIDYCLRKLGAPVIEINVDPEQVEDRVDEAIEYFRTYHYDGIEQMYLKHQVTQKNIKDKYIPLPDWIYGVTKVFPFASTGFNSQSMFDLQYQLRLNDLYNLTSTSVIYFTQVMAHLDLLDMTLNGPTIFRFNRLTGRLYIDTSWGSKIREGEYILIRCYRALDPSTAYRVWNDLWLKHYATALIKKQWGANLSKFDGLQLPGNITLNGKDLHAEAVEEIKALEDELMNKSGPLEFYMG